MTINLDQIRTAVINYVDTKVTVTISNPATSGPNINPGESFTVTLTATNADAANGGVPLKDVVWYVVIQDEDIATFEVPTNPPLVARSGLSRNLPTLTPGSNVREMYLFPSSILGNFRSVGSNNLIPSPIAGNYLSVGDTDSISLTCQAGDGSTGGTCFMFAKIFATVDHDWLYPIDQDSASGVKGITVVG